MYDYIIVGSGLFGTIFAHEAFEAGKSVLILEQRQHVGGNIYTKTIEGVNVHKYGAHIFHTNDSLIWEYVNRFANFNRFTNSPIANYKGNLYSLPFNMYTFNKMWGCVTPFEAQKIINEQKNEIRGKPQNLEQQAISLVGRDVYEKLIKGYTEKQWGRKCSELPPFIIKRIPVRFTYDNNYFNATYQGIPIGGYTKMIERIINGIEVKLNVNYLDNRDFWNSQAKKIVYTGPIDAYFDYSLGHLEYRSLRFDTEILNIPNFQGNAVVNYTDEETPWTRIIEHKWFERFNEATNNIGCKTIISREYSIEWKYGNEPYYPINNDRNSSLYTKYSELSRQRKNVIFGGRLAEYKYYDMDQIIDVALKCANKELH